MIKNQHLEQHTLVTDLMELEKSKSNNLKIDSIFYDLQTTSCAQQTSQRSGSLVKAQVSSLKLILFLACLCDAQNISNKKLHITEVHLGIQISEYFIPTPGMSSGHRV